MMEGVIQLEESNHNVIEVTDLARDYISRKGILKNQQQVIRAVDGISFEVKRGEIFGLLGSNGAGKTSTIKMLTTLLTPTAGKMKVLGFNPVSEEGELRAHINFVYGGERSLYWRITARENLEYFSDLYKIDKRTKQKRIPELLELVGLQDRADERVETFSKGMKQRLQIARSLVNDPEILFLDEPTIGLDPIGARDLRRIVKDLAQMNKTVLITTHYMYEADEICDRVAILNKGKLVAMDTPTNLKKFTEQTSVIELQLTKQEDQLLSQLHHLDFVDSINLKSEEEIFVYCKEPHLVYPSLFPLLSNYEVMNISTRNASLEDVYIHYVNQ